jgi:hypothetical protein
MAAGETPRPPLRLVSPRGRRRRAPRAGPRPSPAEPWLADHATRSVGLALAGGGILTLGGSLAGAILLPTARDRGPGSWGWWRPR